MQPVRFCSACGSQNAPNARFCVACGQPMAVIVTPSPPPAPPVQREGATALRTTTMVIGLLVATLLLIGGCAGYMTGGFFDSIEEGFDLELDDPTDGASTTEEVEGAGAGAMGVSLLLFIAAGLARVATRISLVLLIATFPMLIAVAATDSTSIFAAVYFLSIAAVAVSIVLMTLAWWRERRA